MAVTIKAKKTPEKTVVTVTKAKVKPAPVLEQVEAVEPSEMSDDQLADLYGSLQDKIEALQANPLFAQFKQAQEELQKRMDKYEPDDLIKMKGEHWLLDIGVCSKSPRKILDNAAVAKMMGTETFMAVAKVGVGDAEKYLTPEQVAKVVSAEAFTKNRKVSASFLG